MYATPGTSLDKTIRDYCADRVRFEDYSSPLPFEPYVTVSHHTAQALRTAKHFLVFECTCL